MRDLLNYLREGHSRRARYFREAAEYIAEDNLRTASAASLWMLLILVLFLLATPLIISGWQPTAYHLLFLPALLICCSLTYLGRRKEVDRRGGTALCLLYILVTFLFLFLIDTLGTPENVACFIPVIFVGMFPLFTLPLWLSYGLLILIEICFVITTSLVKPRSVSQYDIFISLVGVGCSMVVNYLTLTLRLQAYRKNTKYQRLSEQDTLAGTYNKHGGRQAALHYIRESNPETVCSLLLLDLDDFKAVNDTRGHLIGDKTLQCVGEVLQGEFRSTDIITRFGGDEFFVLIKNTASRDLARRKGLAIRKALREVTAEKLGFSVSCSIGVVLAKRVDVDFDEMFRQVDAALYRSKSEKGKGQMTICEYIPEKRL